MLLCLLLSEYPFFYALLHPGMIARDLNGLTLRNEIRAAIAYVGNDQSATYVTVATIVVPMPAISGRWAPHKPRHSPLGLHGAVTVRIWIGVGVVSFRNSPRGNLAGDFTFRMPPIPSATMQR